MKTRRYSELILLPDFESRFNYLKLDTTKYSVALIINAESSQLGGKDIIKIERDKCEEIDYTVLGLLSPSITINEIHVRQYYVCWD